MLAMRNLSHALPFDELRQIDAAQILPNLMTEIRPTDRA